MRAFWEKRARGRFATSPVVQTEVGNTGGRWEKAGAGGKKAAKVKGIPAMDGGVCEWYFATENGAFCRRDTLSGEVKKSACCSPNYLK